jgi:putative ABC transport system substrate-binding protein
MRRREFISLVGGAVLAWPRAVIAQVSPRRALIAVLAAGSSTPLTHILSGFSQGLQELGYVEGQNIDIVYRYAEGDQQRLPLLADELVRLKPNVIVTGSTEAVFAVKQATAEIPIVCTALTDPVAFGLVESQARPTGQVTGIMITLDGLPGKQLELLLELVPGATRIGMLFNSRNRTHTLGQRDAKAAAYALGVSLVPVDIRAANDLNAGVQTFVRERVELVLILADALFMSERRQIADLATAAQLLSIYTFREYAAAGGLISYGVNLRESNRRAAAYVDKILKGSKPGDLPVEFPTKLEMVINLRTAKALGITIPPVVLARADEVIE